MSWAPFVPVSPPQNQPGNNPQHSPAPNLTCTRAGCPANMYPPRRTKKNDGWSAGCKSCRGLMYCKDGQEPKFIDRSNETRSSASNPDLARVVAQLDQLTAMVNNLNMGMERFFLSTAGVQAPPSSPVRSPVPNNGWGSTPKDNQKRVQK
jgi:hypothetical protein